MPNHSWIKYYRNSLADASRPKIDVEKTNYVKEVSIDWEPGTVDEEQAGRIIDREEKTHSL